MIIGVLIRFRVSLGSVGSCRIVRWIIRRISATFGSRRDGLVWRLLRSVSAKILGPRSLWRFRWRTFLSEGSWRLQSRDCRDLRLKTPWSWWLVLLCLLSRFGKRCWLLGFWSAGSCLRCWAKECRVSSRIAFALHHRATSANLSLRLWAPFHCCWSLHHRAQSGTLSWLFLSFTARLSSSNWARNQSHRWRLH